MKNLEITPRLEIAQEKLRATNLSVPQILEVVEFWYRANPDRLSVTRWSRFADALKMARESFFGRENRSLFR